MKKFYFLNIILLCLSFSGFSQNVFLKGDVNTDKFPDIFFDINVFNPEIKLKENFKLIENNKEVDFDLEVLEDEITDKSKVVLVLFEDMTHPDHGYQRKVFKYVLEKSLPEFINDDDLVNIAFFDRNRDGSTPLKFALEEYTNDYETALETIRNFNPPSDRFKHQKSSDLYNAIYDGVKDLKEKFPNRNKVLVVFSGGKNLEYSNYNSIGDISLFARKEKVAVYSMQYMIYEHENIDIISEHTTGKFFHIQGTYKLEGDHSKETASDSLISFMQQSVRRLSGKNYRISYTSDYEKDGKLHNLILKTENESLVIPVKVPTCDLICLSKKYPYYAGGIAGGVLLLLLLLLFVSKKRRKKRLLREEMKEMELQQQIMEQEMQLEEQKRFAEQVKQQTLQEKRLREAAERQKKLELEKRKQEEALQAILKSMKINGLPTLRIIHNNKTDDFVIDKPEISIGRAQGNSYVINEPYISSKHFVIYYKDGNYFIKDLNSSNGTFVNGKRISEKKLERNDVIHTGQIKILFIR